MSCVTFFRVRKYKLCETVFIFMWYAKIQHIIPHQSQWCTDLPRTKLWDISFDCRKILGSNQVKNSFLESVIFQFHACMLSSEIAVIKKLWTSFEPWGRDRSQSQTQSPPCWIFRVKQRHPSTAWERTTRQIPHVQGKRYSHYD